MGKQGFWFRLRRTTFACGSCLLAVSTVSCGSGGGGQVEGDLQTDMVISAGRSVTGELRAKNLTIDPGVVVTTTGDATIHTSGMLTLNGEIQPGGKLTIIAEGGSEAGDNGEIDQVDGDVVFVSNANLVPSQATMDTEYAKDPELDGSATRAADPNRGRDDTIYRLAPVKYKDTARSRNIWVDVSGRLKVGKAGQNFNQTMPPGKDGADGSNACTSTGKPGDKGGSIVIRAINVDFAGSVTFNLGKGGKGGNASTPNTCCPAKATGGKGGNTGTCLVSGSAGIENANTFTVNFGGGGDGGTGTATTKAGNDGCGPTRCAELADAKGGEGGVGSGASTAKGNVTGASSVFVGGATGGAGGAATSTGGEGGNDTCCPGGKGAKGGNAKSTGGAGGASTGTVTGGMIASGSFTGGKGGNATSNGGEGGNGHTCCDPVKKGGDGGDGGDATVIVGTGGTGTSGNGADGTAGGKGGEGGNGGDGDPAGGAGAGGTGSGVPNGDPGSAGGPCPGGGGDCKAEVEPNGTIGQANELGTKTCGTGSLSSNSDQDHFKKTLAAGNYQITFTNPVPVQYFFLQVGNQIPQNLEITQPVNFTVPANGTVVIFGFFGSQGAYNFTLTGPL